MSPPTGRGVCISVTCNPSLWVTIMESVNGAITCVVVWTTLTSWQRCDGEERCSAEGMNHGICETVESRRKASVHVWHQPMFFSSRRCTDFFFSMNLIYHTMYRSLRAQCWISNSCFCWFREKSILQHSQPANCPISAVGSVPPTPPPTPPHSGRTGITFCEFWTCPCQGLTLGNQWLQWNIKLCYKL